MEISNNTVAIIGGGVIGGGWAARFLLNGWTVNIYDPDPDAKRKIEAVIANARRSLPGLSDVAMTPEGRVVYCDSIAEAVTAANWIQESAPERLNVKHKILAEIQQYCRADAVIGSSTSGFKPSELQQGAKTPGQIMVCHPFNPVYLIPLVEVVGGENVDQDILQTASGVLSNLGMKPLIIRKEIDAHIADRLLEAVWREGLWLINDGIATTTEIDDAIRFGFGLRWAQMGLFETYRIAGGEAGMAHFIEQFGPCLKWPWTKLMDVPELTDELVKAIADQSDAQSGAHSIRELERIRDDNLVAMMRALKGQNWGAGALLNQYDADRKPSLNDVDIRAPIPTIDRTVPIDWLDYNGHMNESRYGQVFSDATDQFMEFIGVDADYMATGGSFFTVEAHIRYLSEMREGQKLGVRTHCLVAEGKKMHLFHKMFDSDGNLVSTGEYMLIHVSLKTRAASEPDAKIALKLAEISSFHQQLDLPDGVGRSVGAARR
ncbi:MAG: carnitine 3-dehydrogenase [Rhodobacteraceae bacterium]|nr:carnitine 3-dehydrogenase [Paracoccaceae bacterium]